jgi:hypothetical protein
MLTRRQFIFGLIICFAIILTGLTGLLVRKQETRSLIERVVSKNMQGLPISKIDIKKFAEEYEPYFNPSFTKKILSNFIWLNHNELSRNLLPGILLIKIESIERLIVTEFILSTSLIEQENITKEKVIYYGYTPVPQCNPFAQLRS